MNETRNLITNFLTKDYDELSKYIYNDTHRNYFLSDVGQEHYRLLAFISYFTDNIIISDIGTLHGASALALSYNPKNHVVSYDIKNHRLVGDRPNIEYSFVEVGKFDPDILFSTLIFLDTIHDGKSELDVINYLIDNGWEGILILDDIHGFPGLNKVWNDLKLTKIDLTAVGHHSGTGAILFGNNIYTQEFLSYIGKSL